MEVHDGTQVQIKGGPKVPMDAKTKVRTDEERKVPIIGGGKVRTIRKESLLLIYLQGGAKNGVMNFRNLKLGNLKPNLIKTVLLYRVSEKDLICILKKHLLDVF